MTYTENEITEIQTLRLERHEIFRTMAQNVGVVDCHQVHRLEMINKRLYQLTQNPIYL